MRVVYLDIIVQGVQQLVKFYQGSVATLRKRNHAPHRLAQILELLKRKVASFVAQLASSTHLQAGNANYVPMVNTITTRQVPRNARTAQAVLMRPTKEPKVV